MSIFLMSHTATSCPGFNFFIAYFTALPATMQIFHLPRNFIFAAIVCITPTLDNGVLHYFSTHFAFQKRVNLWNDTPRDASCQSRILSSSKARPFALFIFHKLLAQLLACSLTLLNKGVIIISYFASCSFLCCK